MSGRRLCAEQVRMARRLHARGLERDEIARQSGISRDYLEVVVRRRPPVEGVPLAWHPGPGRLGIQDREDIAIGLAQALSFTRIATGLGVAVSTVSREVQANGGRGAYRAWAAHCRAHHNARRPKTAKLACSRLAGVVTDWLLELWSPQEISARLKREFPSDPMMRVSHETIYQSLFVQGRGELRRELTRCLRTGRVARRPRDGGTKAPRIAGMVMISERPAEAADRAVPGHWEGDLILGKDNASAVGTLVERATRYVLLLHLPEGKGPEAVNAAMAKAIATLPAELVRTITWDQGVEMSRHASFKMATGIQIYFCDPHSPWQRGSNENTNGLLRQYMPKGTDLSLLSAEDLLRIQRSLNNRPRQTLGWLKPSEKLAEVLALTG